MKIKKIEKINRSMVFQKGIKVVLAGLMTLILMYISSNIYHKSPFIDVEFQTSQNKTVTYQVFYTTDPKKPASFNEKQSVKKKIPAGLHTERVILPIKNIVQFRFDLGEHPGEVNVLKIALKGKNEQVLNLKDFKFVNIDSQTVQNNQLMLVSKQRNPQMIHQKAIKIEPFRPVDWCFFFGLLCIYGAVSYALVSYLSTFKISGKHALFPLIFLCLFFGALVLPMINISDEVKSVQENRMLEKKPAITEIFKPKSNFGKRFENWFNDHFFGRNQIMFFHDEIRKKTNKVLKGRASIYFKEKGWMFFFPCINKKKENPAFVRPVIQNIKKLNEFCQENNIKFYFLMVPKKEFIYQELLYNYGFDKKQYNQLHEIYAKVKEETQKMNVPFVYPLKELQQAKQKDYVFFKWTHHCTDWGAYIIYEALMKEIQKDFPDISVVTLNEYDKSQSKLIRDAWDREYHPEGLLKEYFHIEKDEANSVNYTYYNHQNKNLLQAKSGQYIKDYSYPLGKYRIMVIGDSMNDNLMQFLPYSAGELKFIRVNRKPLPYSEQWKIMKLYKKEILAFKPDIIIFSFLNSALWQFQFLFSH